MNTRWRQMKRFVSNEDFYYIKQYNEPDPICPCCGGKLINQSWSEEFGCVETDEKCRTCDYQRNWSYGETSLIVGKWDAVYPNRTTYPEVVEIEKEFSRQISLERIHRKDQRRKYYHRLARR
jgi:hypothetical protein